jgi:hypothetical protein
MDFFIRPDVLTLVVGDNVEALPECFLDAVFMIFDARHIFSLFSLRKCS